MRYLYLVARLRSVELHDFAAKKLIIGVGLAIVALGGGYVFLSNSAQSVAEDADTTIEKRTILK